MLSLPWSHPHHATIFSVDAFLGVDENRTNKLMCYSMGFHNKKRSYWLRGVSVWAGAHGSLGGGAAADGARLPPASSRPLGFKVLLIDGFLGVGRKECTGGSVGSAPRTHLV